MAITRQFSVFAESRRGILWKLCTTLARGGVNLLALSAPETSGSGVIRLVVDEVAKARDLLTRRGYAFSEEIVVTVMVPHSRGSLAQVARRLAQAGVNVDFAYGSGADPRGGALLVLGVSDHRAAQRALKG